MTETGNYIYPNTFRFTSFADDTFIPKTMTDAEYLLHDFLSDVMRKMFKLDGGTVDPSLSIPLIEIPGLVMPTKLSYIGPDWGQM